MRVVLADRQGVAGGAERLLAAALPLLGADGLEVMVATAEGALAQWCRDAEIPWSATPPAACDVLVGWGASSVRWTEEVRTPRRVWIRHLTPRGRPDERAAGALALDVVTCPTPEATVRQRALTPSAEVVHLAPGISARPASSPGRRAPMRRALGWTPGTVAVGMVARIDPAKGQDRLVAAASALRRLVPDLRIAFVGGPLLGTEAEQSYERRLGDLVAEGDLDDIVHFAGHVDEPWDWHDALDIEVNLSSHEAFGLATVEAMAAGKPMVATRTQGSAFLLSDPDAGVLIDVDAGAEDVASAIAAQVVRGRARRTTSGPRIARRFGVERFAEQLIAVCRADRDRFEAAVANGGASAPSGG